MYSGELDPQFGDLFDAPARSLFEDSVYAKTHTVKMVVVTTTKEAMTLVKEAMDGSQADNMEGRLAENIKAAFATLSVRTYWRGGRASNWLPPMPTQTDTDMLRISPSTHVQEIELGHVGLTVDKEVYVPKYNSPVRHESPFTDLPILPAPAHPSLLSFPPQEHFMARHRSLGSHSAVLVDPEMTAVPIMHVKYGKTYHMYLENFPANTEVQLDLYKFKVWKKKRRRRKGDCTCISLFLLSLLAPTFQELSAAEHVVHPVRSVQTDEDGHATVEFEFHQKHAAADYFFQVTCS